MSSKTTRFESLLEAVPDALVGMDQNGVIRFVNRQTESLFGYDRDDLIGQPIQRLVPESLWQIYAEHQQDYFADPRARSSGLDLVLSGRQQDGTEFPINISLSHIDTGDVLLVITAVREVTQRKQAVKTAQLIAAIVEYSDDAIMAANLGGTITSWNPAAERMYGYSSKEIIGRSFSILMPEDRAGEMNALLAKVTDGQYVDHFETMRVRKDGSVFPVSLTVAPIRDENGVIVGVSGVHRDVTEQRKALAVAERLAAIVEYSDDAILGSTLEGIVTSWNPAAERLYGYSSEETIGKPLTILTPQDRAGEIQAVLSTIRAGQHVEHLETVRVRKNGTVFPVSLTVSPIRDAGGAVVGASAITRNMTELTHAAQYARSLIEAAMDPLVTINAEGTIDDVNEATVKVTGIPRDRLIGTDFSQYFTDPNKARQGYQLVFAQGSVTDYPLTMRHRDGTLTDILYNASVYRGFDGKALGVSAVGRDVTKQKEAFEAAQRLAAIVEYSDDAILGETLDSIITSWNTAAERMYGYSSAEIVGKSIDLLSPKDQLNEIKTILAEVKSGQPVQHIETERVRKDGTTFPVSLTISPILDDKDTVVGASVIYRDVSEQRRVLETAERMAAIVEYSDDAIIGRTLDGVITSWNPAAARMFGYASAEIVGKSVDLLTPKGLAGEIKVIVAKVKAGQPVDHLETNRVRKDGTVFPVSLTVSPIRDAGGVIIGASVIARDVTQQRQAQYARSLIEASLDPLVTISTEGVITDANEATIKVTGVPRDKLIGTAFSDYFTDPNKANEGYQRVFEQGLVTDFPLTLRHRNGTLTEVLYNASVYRDADGEVLGVFAAARDVTEQRKASEYARSLIQAQAEIAQQAKELDRLAELERFQRLTVGRELKMIELKIENESLRRLVQMDQGEPDD